MLESAWKTILFAVKPDRFKISLLLFFILLGNIFAYSTPYFFKLIVDYISTVPREDFEVNALTFPLLGIIVFLVGQEIAFRIGHILEIVSMLRIFDRITTSLFNQLLERPTSYFEDKLSGELSRRVEQIGGGVSYFIEQFPWYLGWQVISAFATAILLSIAHMYLFVAMAVWLILFLSTSYFLLRWQYTTSQRTAETHAKLSGNIVDTIGNIPIVHSFAAEKHELKHYRGYMDPLIAAEKKERWIFLFNKVHQGTSIILLGITLTFLSIWLFRIGEVSIGDFVIVATTLPVLAGVVWNFGDTILTAIKQFGVLKNAVEGLQAKVEKVKAGKKVLTADNFSISFQNIGFTYQDMNTEVFKSFSLEVKNGEKVGIVGISGAGKSTIIKLLLRQYDSITGKILIGNIDIKTLTLESLRKSIAFVPQDTSLFYRSLYDNIRYARPDASENEVLDASKRAHAHEFIMSYPGKYETRVGERGVKLSGGQRQRIAIARAILKDAPILVLDEATSALDSASEEIVQQGIHILFEKRTVLAIAHRLSTLLAMDRIVVMDEERVVEEGTPNDLLNLEQGIFKSMWEHQKNGFLINELGNS